MKAFRFPKIVVLFFFVLLCLLFYAFGATCYICSIASQNEEFLIARDIVGDWVISPNDTLGRFFDGAVGRTPRSGGENFSIENAEEIVSDLNELKSVKALSLAAVETQYTLIVKGRFKTVDEKWLQGRSFQAVDNRMGYDGETYTTLTSFQTGDYYYDHIYGVDSGDLVSFFEGRAAMSSSALQGREEHSSLRQSKKNSVLPMKMSMLHLQSPSPAVRHLLLTGGLLRFLSQDTSGFPKQRKQRIGEMTG